jgi:cytochrome c553
MSRIARLKRMLGIAALGAVGLMVASSAFVYLSSQAIVNRTYDVPLSSFSAAASPLPLEEGERLARTRGCIGCHGMQMEGRVLVDIPWVGRIVAANLTRAAREQSDAELERVIRKGVMRDGRSVWMMPSPMLAHLSDEDLGIIIGYMRSVPESDGPRSSMELGILGRIGLLTGAHVPLAAGIGTDAAAGAPDRRDPLALGRYVAMTACSECHGEKLRGYAEEGIPSLAIVAAYPAEAFRRLMRDGIALGDRELGLMSNVSRGRFSHFTAEEVDALHAYLGGAWATANP